MATSGMDSTPVSRVICRPGLCYLLIGKTGNGKSSTGNSILLKDDLFKVSEGMGEESETFDVTLESNYFEGRRMEVVDTPGLQDTRIMGDAFAFLHTKKIKNDPQIELMIHALSKAIVLCKTGFHAVIVVLQFAQRMTSEELNCLTLLEKVFGDEVLKKQCIIVFSHGENFKRKCPGKTLEEMCRTLKGGLASFLKKCDYRCVLFDNVTEDKEKRRLQVCNLVAMTDKICKDGQPYSCDIFMKSRTALYASLGNGESGAASFENMYECITSNLENLSRKLDVLKNDEKKMCFAILSEDLMTFKGMLKKEDVPTIIDSLVQKLNEETCRLNDIVTFNSEIREWRKERDAAAAKTVSKDVEESCFPGSSQVTLADGQTKKMQELAVGDRILVRKRCGQLAFDTVYMFGHRDPDRWNRYLVIETRSNSVRISQGHYIFCLRDGVEACLPARQVRCGDQLLTSDGVKLTPETVCGIKREDKQGLYAPFTLSGSLVVDGSLASCYVDLVSPDLGHALLWPVRKLYWLSPGTLAWMNGGDKGKEIPPWVEPLLKLL